MNRRFLRISIAVLLILGVGFTGSAIAAQGGGGGNGGGGGGGNEPPDFGELIFLDRDDFGVPKLDGNQCQQPIAFPSETCIVDCTVEPCLVPVDPLTCAVEAAYATCTQEVDFGRINVARAPDSVFESQLEDVVVNLAIADCVSLDPAGRLVGSSVVGENLVESSTIDSPLQSLAIYRQLMLTGDLGVPLPDGVDIWTTAARGLGTASGKTGEVNVDLVAYVNHILGLSDPDTATVLPKLCIQVKEEVMGTVQLVEKCFLDYGAVPHDPPNGNGNGFSYRRIDNFNALPSPPYIDNPSGTTDVDGWFEYLVPLSFHDDPPWFELTQGPIVTTVFPNGNGGDPGFTEGNIGGFAQAADDTRAVINYMHDWAVPGGYETQVPCEVSGDINYDLSISEESGLQVPKQMIATAEDREFVVTVANAGPDAATGSVWVTAELANGGNVLVGEATGPFEIPFVDLAEGVSESTTKVFTIQEPHERTTINWTATIEAEHDVNYGNNEVTATTNVKVTGSGGGGGGGSKGGGH